MDTATADMPTSETPLPNVDETETRIRIAEGSLFAKVWTPDARDAAAPAPIILFHDSLGSVDLWRGFPRRLAATTGRRVVAYDRLGFGRSDPHPGRLDVEFVAAEGQRTIPALCDQLEIADFVACGHSVGGGMAVETAALFPVRCRALVTIAAQAFVEDKTLAGIRVAQRGFEDPANLAKLAKYHGEKTEWVADAWINTWLSPEFADWTLDKALAKVRCPVLAIHGEWDEYGSDEHPTRIAAGRGTARILPKTGHVPHRENEALLVEVINEFLRGVVALGSPPDLPPSSTGGGVNPLPREVGEG
ncbi:alpha/beta fold hydrolase [Azospirillum rugosum]|uniref:Pimeloyl-ACP methyl ester carboxylesterase n=1 Tax=Azospirillum rugosum TaxID=416170 RepID=A0ABS4SY90_9PROT|nr:alpha/beta hydrolase [Azospirillum rugosum]MBP2296962.1 pimeloyl-ACP methyl ester carboxylesterase [Azospirillum rugosum]MDQ0530721.1 pimeloyl-ACP methyl ester carboxylesterase [Azospirillum rugosum]